MNTFFIFVCIYAAMIAMSFWEAYSEGQNTWDKGKLGWRIKIGNYSLTAYHFYIFGVMWPLLLILPLIIHGWDRKLFGILISAYFSGMVIEDIGWYIVNPVVKFSQLNPEFANYYPWVKIWKWKLPALHIVGLSVSVLSWYFVWR